LLSLVVAGALAVAGCAAQRAVGPLEVGLGQTSTEVARTLRRYDFCANGEPDVGRQVFPQCGRPGAVFGDAWVVAHYAGGRTVRVQRFERWADRDRATARWGQLVDRRTALGAPSEAARERVFARQGLPDRIRSWRAFEHGDTLIAIYLFDVTASTEPAILEEILPLDGP
jgi:hypothetical protein